MEMNINKMFQDKNKEILKNSLILEMERNLEALKNTTDNCVALEINKLAMFFKKYFFEIEIEYKKEELLGILFREKNKINNIVNSKIEEKKTKIKEKFLEKEIEDDIVKEEYLNEYNEFIAKETEQLNDELDLLLKKEICTEFSQEIIRKYKLESKEQEERIYSRINILFNNNIIKKIQEQIKFRDESLKNMAIESYNKYISLNKQTIEQ